MIQNSTVVRRKKNGLRDMEYLSVICTNDVYVGQKENLSDGYGIQNIVIIDDASWKNFSIQNLYEVYGKNLFIRRQRIRSWYTSEN